jgi:hypothetical protein
MPFWKREASSLPSASSSDLQPAPGSDQAQPHGALACSERGCPRHDAVVCSYIDRRRRPCPTAWCTDHRLLLAGRPLCRRHHRILAAAAPDEFQTLVALPDLDNRSPSLADYVGDALQPRVLELLNALRRPGTEDQVAGEPVHVIHAGGGARRWDRTWKLFDHTGVHAKISVEVDEGHDPEVWVRVGHQVVAQATPPWIERRRQGLPALGDQEDAEGRARFYDALWEPVPARVMAELEANRSLAGY